MNGSKLALVLGLAALAGLGLAIPGMLGAKLEPAPIPLPAMEVGAAAVAAPVGCTLDAEPVRLEALVPESKRVEAAAPGGAVDPTLRVPIQTLRTGAVLHPIARPVEQPAVRPNSVYVGVPKNAAGPNRAQMALKQRNVLGRSYAAGKALPAGQSAKAAGLGSAEQDRSGYSPPVSSAASDAHSGAVRAEPVRSPMPSGTATRVPIQKLPPPK